MIEKVVNPSCLRNQHPILEALLPWLSEPGQLLELASGTGQHGVYIGQHLPHIRWQLTEHPSQIQLSQPWQQAANLSNVLPCIELDINQPNWPAELGQFQYSFCANLLHYVSEQEVHHIFKAVSRVLNTQGLFFCYGPINEQGFTSDGNASLDKWLKEDVNAQAGIKELSFLQSSAQQQGLTLKQRLNLPANNVILIFEKQ